MAAAVVASGCGGTDKDSDDGEVGGHCYPNGTCNVGLICNAGICVPLGSPVDASFDATLDALVCTDGALEPNDTVQSAFVTSVATSQTSRTLTGLMICPSNDRDNYAVTIITANTNLEMVIDFDTAGPTVQGSILNTGGTPIANASLVIPGRRRAYSPNLPTGNYYVLAYAAPGDVSSYVLSVNVTGP